MAKTMRYGVYLPAFGPLGNPLDLVELAVRAEAAGWDGVFLWDHVRTEHQPVADTWSTLAAIAQATERIRLGPMVTPLPRRRPWVVARQADTVSRLSGGRLVLGAGLGSDESGDFSAFGEPTGAPARSAMLDEGLGIMRAMWAGTPLRHDGPHYRVDLPAAPPAPHPIPVWIAMSRRHPKVLARAAGADGIFPSPGGRTPSPAEIAELVAAVPVRDVVVSGNASPAWAEPPRADVRALAAAGATWWLESLFYLDPLALSLQVVDAGPGYWRNTR